MCPVAPIITSFRLSLPPSNKVVKATKILSSHSRMHRLVSFGKCTKKQNKAVPTTCLSGIVTYSQGLCGNYIFVLPKELWVPKLGTTPLSSWGTGWTTGLG